MVVTGINPHIPVTVIILHSNIHSLRDPGNFNTCLGLQTTDSDNKVQRTEKPFALNKYTTKLPVLLGCYVMSLIICIPVYRDAVLGFKCKGEIVKEK